MKWLVSISFFLLPLKSIGCDCVTTTLINHFQYSEFVATAKIVKIQPNKQNEDYHDIEIEIINLYKGKFITSLQIQSVQRSSCAFYTPAGSTWLIFASRDNNGFLSFGACSGSLQMDRQFDTILYPGLDKKYAASIALKLGALAFLKKYESITSNQYHLNLSLSQSSLDSLKGFNTNNRLAVYKVKISEKLTVAGIKTLTGFDNREMSVKLLACLRKNLLVQPKDKKLKTIPKATSLILIYYYYPAEAGYPGFITTYDL